MGDKMIYIIWFLLGMFAVVIGIVLGYESLKKSLENDGFLIRRDPDTKTYRIYKRRIGSNGEVWEEVR